MLFIDQVAAHTGVQGAVLEFRAQLLVGQNAQCRAQVLGPRCRVPGRTQGFHDAIGCRTGMAKKHQGGFQGGLEMLPQCFELGCQLFPIALIDGLCDGFDVQRRCAFKQLGQGILLSHIPLEPTLGNDFRVVRRQRGSQGGGFELCGVFAHQRLFTILRVRGEAPGSALDDDAEKSAELAIAGFAIFMQSVDDAEQKLRFRRVARHRLDGLAGHFLDHVLVARIEAPTRELAKQ